MRSDAINKEILGYFKKCKTLSDNAMYIYADELACFICNTYFKYEVEFYERDLVVSLINIFFKIGNTINATRLINLVEKLTEKGMKSKKSKYLLEDFLPIISREMQDKLQYPIDPNLEYSKYVRNFEPNYLRVSLLFSAINSIENLHSIGPIRVLDIGAGYGSLAYIFKRNGHLVDTIDIKEKPQTFYNSFNIFDLPQKYHKISKFKPIPPFKYKFDLINASQICFNGHKTNYLWDVEEWKFFLKDIHDNFLSKNGVIYLGFNYENTVIENKRLNLGKKTLELFFAPYINKILLDGLKSKVARFTKADISKIIKY